MKKFFKTLALLVCTVCSLVLVSCGGGSNKPISYEEFHAKALEAHENAPKITKGHIVINIRTRYENISYESDFTVDGDAVWLAEEPFYYNWRDKIFPAIKGRAYLYENYGENTDYYYNEKEGFTINQMFNDEISHQDLFDTNGYLIKSWDPTLGDDYVTTIEWSNE